MGASWGGLAGTAATDNAGTGAGTGAGTDAEEQKRRRNGAKHQTSRDAEEQKRRKTTHDVGEPGEAEGVGEGAVAVHAQGGEGARGRINLREIGGILEDFEGFRGRRIGVRRRMDNGGRGLRARKVSGGRAP